MTLKEKLNALRDAGWTDEEISVALGKNLGGTGPSTRTILRWRSGRGKPHRVYLKAIDALTQEKNRAD